MTTAGVAVPNRIEEQRAHMIPLPVVAEAFEMMAMDIVGLLDGYHKFDQGIDTSLSSVINRLQSIDIEHVAKESMK